MAKNLVIVESPAKVKTIKKFLGKNYEVVASNGHVRDLPKSQLGFDPANDFEPKYITIRGKGDILANLRKEVKKADHIYLATDPDREGEAISWHLFFALKLENKKVSRITFNEITQSAVKESLKHPREIDLDLVDAQQARRILDRMVGYKISPLLWTKIKRGLSAGRVQSAALRLISDRENEINAFESKEYWTVDAKLADAKGHTVECKLLSDNNGKIEINNEAEADKIEKLVTGKKVKAEKVKHSSRKKQAPFPFTTSTLQQEASKQLNFSTQKTMRLAQQLYEGVEIKGHGTVGMITYLRTDSTRISEEAKHMLHDYIKNSYGNEYDGPDKAVKSKGKVQDAHEAIRPTDLSLSPSAVSDSLSRDQLRLYKIIYNRFVASGMADAVYDTFSASFNAEGYVFTANASKLSFAGFLSVYRSDDEKDKEGSAFVSSLNDGDELTIKSVEKTQHFTQPPAHFNEAALVKAMEEQGIGRPSTYAPTISTLLGRHYVTKEEKNLYMTDLGDAVNSIMTDCFPEVVDEKFTAKMESLLDDVEEGKIEWKMPLREYYPEIEKSVEFAEKKLEKIVIADEVTDVLCDECGRNMVIKYGPHGKFLACPGFPDCRFTKPYLEKIGVACPKCGRDIVIRKTKKGRRYYGCEGAPECDFMSWSKPSATKSDN
ncbi:MAG: type I DNA topoisomerase [Lachnospiraceae bacterium]|nr:type I DNA topoisomerase [Lachnospiraceae bacterium]